MNVFKQSEIRISSPSFHFTSVKKMQNTNYANICLIYSSTLYYKSLKWILSLNSSPLKCAIHVYS